MKGNDIDAEADALRSGLHAEAGVVTVSQPPIAAVRRGAGKRRTLRWTFQGLSGVAVTCALVGGIVAWSPGRGSESDPAPAGPAAPAPTMTAQPTPDARSGPPSTTAPTAAASGYLLASDLGPAWAGPAGDTATRKELTLAGSECQAAGDYQPQVPVRPALSRTYIQSSGSGQQTNVLLEALYTFAPGTGASVMDKVRTALGTGCGTPEIIKLLPTVPTVGDETIVFTAGGPTRNILVRSGDRVASAVINIVPPGQDGTAWIDHVAKQMAVRLTAG